MAKKGNPAKTPRGKDHDSGTPLIFTAQCEGDCGSTVSITLDSEDPHRSLTLGETGWSAINALENGSVVFLCKSCFEKTEPEGENGPLDEEEEDDDLSFDDQAG